VIEQAGEYVCAVQSATTAVRRVVTLGQTDDTVVEVVAGLAEGERVFMNPRSILGDAPATVPSEAIDETVSRPASRPPA
jgi:multidrug efflux pump subunit AcrA (membrane-fusion protein)